MAHVVNLGPCISHSEFKQKNSYRNLAVNQLYISISEYDIPVSKEYE